MDLWILNSFESVRAIIFDGCKDAVWNVNAEKEYHEKKES